MKSYYEHERSEIRSLLPKQASSVLEVGAGAGTTLKWIKSISPEVRTTGVELNPALEAQLTKNADVAIIGKIEERYSELQRYDLILLLDVLEHLLDPVGALKMLAGSLNPGGQVIVSVPNIAHLSVSVPLLIGRSFTYTDAGILDRTHLKFFVERSAVELLNSAGFIVTKGIASGLRGPRARVLNSVSFGLLLHHLTKQYIMLGELNKNKMNQQRICWTTAE